MMLTMETGEKIKSKREEKKVSQSELARRTGLAIATISRIENGKYEPRRATVMAIARALDIEVSELEQ